MSPQKTVGVTIGSGDPFERMARLASQRFTACTGLPAVILGNADRERLHLHKPHHLKFELFRLVPDAEEIVFFDADVIFCSPFDVQELRSPHGFSAVLDFVDASWIVRDAERAGIPSTSYFNSGLFWIHRSRADVLPRARELRLSGEITSPFNDQPFLNAAVARTGGAHYLNKRWNYHVDRKATKTLADVIGAHIHWISQDAENLAKYYAAPRSLFWRELAEAAL